MAPDLEQTILKQDLSGLRQMSNSGADGAVLIRIAAIGAFTILSLWIAPGLATAVSRAGEIDITLAMVRSMMLCAVINWLPAFRAPSGAGLTSGTSDTRTSSGRSG
jgi:hypothetical protein